MKSSAITIKKKIGKEINVIEKGQKKKTGGKLSRVKKERNDRKAPRMCQGNRDTVLVQKNKLKK